MQIIDPVINRSDAMFPTSVSGGVHVSTGDGSEGINAVYAQAYRTADNQNHLLLTNKSGAEQVVQIAVNGVRLHAPFRTRSIGSPNPRAENTPKNHDVVTLTTGASVDQVAIPPYGVMDAA